MPTILIKVPQGAFPGEQRTRLAKKVNDAAALCEQMPDEPRKRFLNWVTVEEVAHGLFTCGGSDATDRVIPCIAVVYLPAGVLDGAFRARYVAAMHAAFSASLAPDEKRQIASSVILHEVPDGQWGANGNVWRLPDFAKAAGYAHLQSLV
jgi:phenylpyruvate tautomerase PptA (4-oxalocrotonate tautomerase family)